MKYFYPLIIFSLFISSVSHSEDQKRLPNVTKEENKKLREGYHADEIDKILKCSIDLISNQYNGAESPKVGAEYLETILRNLYIDGNDYNPIVENCQEKLRQYKRDFKKGNINVKHADLTLISNDFTKRVSAVLTAHREIALCKNIIGVSVQAGLLLSFGVGYDHYSCKSALGRKFSITGPNGAFGGGFGVNLDVGSAALSKRKRLAYNMISNLGKGFVNIDWSENAAFGPVSFGSYVSDKFKESDVNYYKASFGFGMHGFGRSGVLWRVNRGFDMEYIYTLLDLPFRPKNQ